MCSTPRPPEEGAETGAKQPQLDVAVVIEERIVLHDLRDVPSGFAMLMGTIYCLNLEYPHNMKYSFEFLQRVIMKIKPDDCSPKIHGLRNKLLKYHL
uniref:Uncharacterized protein n=1 Tax=Scleropages formosus TaxID=113540 RepID=A0A8C9R5Q3_SCLFO